jgi:prolyl 4-hydroxylase
MVANPEKSIKGSTINYNKVQQLSWKPRVFYYRGFLSEDTCNHILELGTS